MNDITLVSLNIAKEFKGKVTYQHNAVGIFLLIGALEKAGFRASFHECLLQHGRTLRQELDGFMAAIDTAPPVIGIGCHSVHLPFAVKAAEEIKRKFPEKTVILGGPGPSGTAAELMEKFPFIDAVAVGEAEETLVEIMRGGVESLPEIKGIVHRRGGKVTDNSRRPRIEDLDKLPPPAYHLADFRGKYQIATVITSRGCPYRCGFCSLTHFDGNKIRHNSIDNVIKEMRLLSEEYGFKDLFFVDPNFTVDKKRTIELCRRIRAEKLPLSWFCMTRVEAMDEELMKELGDGGCRTIFYGVDTGSDAVMKRIKHGYDVKKALEVVARTTGYIRNVEVGFMWGFPFETLEDFRQTLKAREHVERDLGCTAQLRWLEPYPATELFREYHKELFMPVGHSLTWHPDKLESLIGGGKTYYRPDGDTCRIPKDVTSVRYLIAASHVASLCRDLIEGSPRLFSDYYRYKTPDLDEKLKLAADYSLY